MSKTYKSLFDIPSDIWLEAAEIRDINIDVRYFGKRIDNPKHISAGVCYTLEELGVSNAYVLMDASLEPHNRGIMAAIHTVTNDARVLFCLLMYHATLSIETSCAKNKKNK